VFGFDFSFIVVENFVAMGKVFGGDVIEIGIVFGEDVFIDLVDGFEYFNDRGWI